jgi:hypothetical protein
MPAGKTKIHELTVAESEQCFLKHINYLSKIWKLQLQKESEI